MIVGDGPERSTLEGLVHRLGLDGRVRLERARPQPEILDEYARAEIVALAPRVMADGDRDGIPNVILEAMAAGVPVVTTAVSALPEVITDDGTGLLVPPDDPDALAGALQGLLEDPARRERLGAAGREHVAAAFELGRAVAPLATVFRTCLGLPSEELATI